MSTPSNHGEAWSEDHVQQLKQLVSENTPTRVIALKLERTADSVRDKASELGISLMPPNQSPFG